MAKGTWSANDKDSELIAANRQRKGLIIESYSGDQVFLGFGESGAVDDGISITAGEKKEITGRTARLAVHGICASTNTASGGYQETY